LAQGAACAVQAAPFLTNMVHGTGGSRREADVHLPGDLGWACKR